MKYIAYAIGDNTNYDYNVNNFDDAATEDEIDAFVKGRALKARMSGKYDVDTLFAEWHFIEQEEYDREVGIDNNL